MRYLFYNYRYRHSRNSTRSLIVLIQPSETIWNRRNQSSSSSVRTTATSAPNKQWTLGRTLYRQLLRWCRDNSHEIPLSGILPPVTLHPPNIDQDTLRALFQQQHPTDGDGDGEDAAAAPLRLRALLPNNSIVTGTHLTVPLRSTRDVRNLFRFVFRCNAAPSSPPDHSRSRVALAFETIKSLGGLGAALDHLRRRREQHADRTGVHFTVGQVVRHKTERWRGVIVRWERNPGEETATAPTRSQKTQSGKSSLTNKRYEVVGGTAGQTQSKDEGGGGVDDDALPSDSIQYTMILDAGDAVLFRTKIKSNNRGHSDADALMPVAWQSDLDLVTDVNLCRIRGKMVSSYFDRFHAASRCFVPNETRQYEYPLDLAHQQAPPAQQRSNNAGGDGSDAAANIEVIAEKKRQALGRGITSSIQRMASRLERTILDRTSCPESRGLALLETYRERIEALAHGNIETDEEILGSKANNNDAEIATWHLRFLLNLSLELSELLQQRRLSQASRDGNADNGGDDEDARSQRATVQFQLGDVIEHTKYGFRGVVVAWDPRPVVDVSQWDGLTDIQNASELPFYHVIPDQQDCIEAFGGERPFRYVCQANLRACPPSRMRNLQVELEPDWKQEGDRHIPPADLRFKFAVDDESDENDRVTFECLSALQAELNQLHVAQRDGVTNEDGVLADIVKEFSMDVLFEFLKLSDNMTTAVAVEETLKELWKSHADLETRFRLESGISELMRGNKERALVVFLELVKTDPSYAEAWNKIATCHFVMGDMQSSLEASERTLELLPNHFRALDGMGLIQYETGRFKLAAGSFRRSLRLDPWSPVSSRLASCLDLLYGNDLEDERRAAEEVGPYQ